MGASMPGAPPAAKAFSGANSSPINGELIPAPLTPAQQEVFTGDTVSPHPNRAESAS